MSYGADEVSETTTFTWRVVREDGSYTVTEIYPGGESRSFHFVPDRYVVPLIAERRAQVLREIERMKAHLTRVSGEVGRLFEAEKST